MRLASCGLLVAQIVARRVYPIAWVTYYVGRLTQGRIVSRDPRYDILFEPVQIGPVTARNRFYQVPHCNGMGRNHPTSMAVMRGIKAEGGWAVICTEQCDIHPTTETSREVRLWDERDIPTLARMTELVHRHDGLAAVELTHMGYHANNHTSREIPMAPSARPSDSINPVHAREMDLTDIANYRRWHWQAALNAQQAGFDIVCVYAGHDLSLLMHFLSPRQNRRTDQYGGSMENRCRLLREVIEDTKEAVGDKMGVVVRLAVDELMGERGILAEREGHAVMDMLGELPDLWDVNCSNWDNDSITSRFAEEGFQEPYTQFVKQHTSKPVVGVGRYTSPDRMVSLIKKGALDMIGAARPSIADPFLPKKIEEGRIEDIRECIGCNICVAGDNLNTPMRCTQNPTSGEEWRKSWHPERIAARHADQRVLIVGAGPSGLEAARALGQRGYDVLLADAAIELGGRIRHECRLPGLAATSRVRDWRIGQIAPMPNVQVFPDSRMSAKDILETDCQHIAIATGARWRRDGAGRFHDHAMPGTEQHSARVFTPDDIFAGKLPEGQIVLFDDDHYYMGGVIAEKLATSGCNVTLVTTAGHASEWTQNTLELGRIQKRLYEAGVTVIANTAVTAIGATDAHLSNVYTSSDQSMACDAVVLVTAPQAQDVLYHELTAQMSAASHNVQSVNRIGDCYGPGTIAAAVYSGHRYAREMGCEVEVDVVPFRRELVELSVDVELPG